MIIVHLLGDFKKRIPRRLLTEEFKKEAIKWVTEQQLNTESSVGNAYYPVS